MKYLRLLAFCTALLATGQTPAAPADPHWHDFDFEYGSWTARARLLGHRLVGAHDWIDFRGTLVVHKLWNGKGNMSELEISSAHSSIEGGALHAYNPDTHEWSVWFVNTATGQLGVPSVGRFANGRGVLYDHEPYRGRPVYVRQIFSNISPHTFNFAQAFSTDEGKTWETNLLIYYTR